MSNIPIQTTRKLDEFPALDENIILNLSDKYIKIRFSRECQKVEQESRQILKGFTIYRFICTMILVPYLYHAVGNLSDEFPILERIHLQIQGWVDYKIL